MDDTGNNTFLTYGPAQKTKTTHICQPDTVTSRTRVEPDTQQEAQSVKDTDTWSSHLQAHTQVASQSTSRDGDKGRRGYHEHATYTSVAWVDVTSCDVYTYVCVLLRAR